MPKLDIAAIPLKRGGSYPPPYNELVAKRSLRQLSAPGGLTDFEANQVILPPGAVSSQRHWHEGEDEFVVILSGVAVLVEENARTPMGAGECAVFPKGVANAHHLINESDGDCVFIAISIAETKPCHYPDIDMRWDPITDRSTREDGSPL
jgi:uncharacterized cupin superfamily protein